MSFLSRLFNRNKVTCPRCLGKGVVDTADIKRLKKELYWLPGECAYCNGAGKVSPKKLSMLNPDTAYLTTDLPKREREKLFKADTAALQRAKEQEAEVEKLVKKIEYFYYIQNQEAEQIADYLLKTYLRSANPEIEREEAIEYVEEVIRSKLKKN